MLDASIYCAYPHMLPSDSAYRCRRCGSGPVMGTDGFLMDHCMNCGNWQSCGEPLDLGFGRIKAFFANILQKLKARLSRQPADQEGDGALTPAPSN